jgi:hypothetical protein
MSMAQMVTLRAAGLVVSRVTAYRIRHAGFFRKRGIFGGMEPKLSPSDASNPTVRRTEACLGANASACEGDGRVAVDRVGGEDRMSLYQVSTRASRRRRIGAWLRTRWYWRIGSGRHHRGSDVSSRYAYAPKVVQRALVPPGGPSSADLADADVDALVESQPTVRLSVPTVKLRPGLDSGAGTDAPVTSSHGDGRAGASHESTNGMPKVPQQRPPSRAPSVYPNAYRER